MKILKTAAISALTGQIAAMLFLFLAGLFLKNNDNPLKMTNIVVYLAMFLSSSLCGLLASMLSEEQKLPAGLAAGAMSALLTLLLSFLPGSGDASPWRTIFVLILQTLLPMLICFLSMKKAGSHKAGRRRAQKRYMQR